MILYLIKKEFKNKLKEYIMENYTFSTNTIQVGKLAPFFNQLFKGKDCPPYYPRIIQVTPIKIPSFEDIYMKILKGEDTKMPPINTITHTFETVVDYKVQHSPNKTLNVQFTYIINLQPVTTTQYKCVKQGAQLKISNDINDGGDLICSKPLVVENENEDLRWVVLETIKLCQDSNEKLLKKYNIQ